MRNVVIGDVHGEFGKLNQFISKKSPDTVIVCGDFGYWPSLVEEKISYGWGGQASFYKKKVSDCLEKIKPQGSKIYFCDGNHEQHSELNGYQDGQIHELARNIFFCSRGSSLSINDNNILFMGGARSIDKNMRTEGVDWFAEETISYADYERAMIHEKIDVVVSHTCPEYFFPDILKYNISKINDPSCKALSGIFDEYKPDRWFFGHFHFYHEGYRKGCYWKCLNYLGNPVNGRPWVWL